MKYVLLFSVLFFGCEGRAKWAEEMREKEKKERIERREYLKHIRVGEVFVSDRDAVLMESNTRYEKFRVYDFTADPSFLFVTVKKGVIVSVYRGERGFE